MSSAKEEREIEHLLQQLEKLTAGPDWQQKEGAFFHLQLEDMAPIGPFEVQDLRDFILHRSLPETSLIKDAKAGGAWMRLFDHPMFLRKNHERSAGLELPEHLGIYYLQEGKKTGPINAAQLREKVKSKEVLVTQMVSLDDGQSWAKLYHYEEFDRRKDQDTHLPRTPEWKVFKGEQEDKPLSSVTKNIMGLDVLSHQYNPDFVPEEEQEDHYEEDEQGEVTSLKTVSRQKRPNKNSSNLPYMMVAAVAVVGIFFLITTSQKTQVKGQTQIKKEMSEKAKKLDEKYTLKKDEDKASKEESNGPVKIKTRKLQVSTSRKPAAQEEEGQESGKKFQNLKLERYQKKIQESRERGESRRVRQRKRPSRTTSRNKQSRKERVRESTRPGDPPEEREPEDFESEFDEQDPDDELFAEDEEPRPNEDEEFSDERNPSSEDEEELYYDGPEDDADDYIDEGYEDYPEAEESY